MEEWKIRLKKSREGKNLNKTAFARLVEVSNATVTDWEKSVDDGGIKEISGAKLTKVSEVLGVDPRWLLNGSQKTVHDDGHEASSASPPIKKMQPESVQGDVLRRAVELMETYSLADAGERDRIDRLVRNIRRRLGAVDQAERGTT